MKKELEKTYYDDLVKQISNDDDKEKVLSSLFYLVTKDHPELILKYVEFFKERKRGYKMNQWIKRYFNIAKETASWSKDPSRQIGAVIIGDKGQIKSQGYNGFPRGVKDTMERYNDRPTKYKYVCHAEANAVYNALHNGTSVLGDTIYVTGLPVCHECAKAVIQVGISKVVYDTPIKSDAKWSESCALALEMFDEAGVEHEFIESDNERKVIAIDVTDETTSEDLKN
jgi:dCMP deaminase